MSSKLAGLDPLIDRSEEYDFLVLELSEWARMGYGS